MPMRRLDAEELHDGLIAITGRLNLEQGGKPDKVQVREGGYVTGEPGEADGGAACTSNNGGNT